MIYKHLLPFIAPECKVQQNMIKKLGKTIRFLMATKFLPSILFIDNCGIVKWLIDVSFAVRDDMKSRADLCMSLGQGTIYTTSTKQKLNTTSSTEAELVGVLTGMPKMVWTRYFIEAQGYIVDDVYVYQDNQSAILIETNVMKSVGKNL